MLIQPHDSTAHTGKHNAPQFRACSSLQTQPSYIRVAQPTTEGGTGCHAAAAAKRARLTGLTARHNSLLSILPVCVTLRPVSGGHGTAPPSHQRCAPPVPRHQ